VISMNKRFLYIVNILAIIVLSCSSGIEPDKIHSLSEIKRDAKNGQEIRSQGILTEKTGKREFLVSDNLGEIKIELPGFKKESKYIKQNSKVIFSGTYRKKIFSEPFIEVTYLKVVEDFK
jgi:uncharacterized protein YdeI (BOF family)